MPRAFACSILLLMVVGCTSSKKDALPLGVAAFDFKPADVSQMEIVRFREDVGEHWAMQLERDDSKRWRIASLSDSSDSLQDRLAYSEIIDHLLETMTNVNVDEVAGPKEAIASLGLQTPAFAIRIKTPQKLFEIQLRDRDGVTLALFPGRSSSAYRVSGAFLAILGRIDSPMQLRETRFAMIDPDDYDEISIGSKYMQREGAVWNDRAHHRVQSDIGGWLRNLSDLPILKFQDAKDSPKNFPIKMSLRDRKGGAVNLEFNRANGRVFARNSLRPDALFEVNAAAFERLGLGR